MKAILLFPIIALCYAIPMFAQPQFSPTGAEWWYGFKQTFIYSEGWDHLVYEKDTVIAGLSCKKLIQNVYSRSNDTSAYALTKYTRFLAQKGDSVFVYSDPVWLLRWRTNPVVGSTYVIQRYSWSPAYTFTIKVDSIKMVNLGGQILKKIWQTGTGSFGLIGGSVVIYDKIGPENEDFDYTQCWGSFDCNPPALCKYKDDQFPLYEFTAPVCDLITSTQNPIQFGEVPVYPNPCQDILHLDIAHLGLNNLKIAVLNQTGTLVKAFELPVSATVELETKDLPPGIYFYQLTGKNAVYSGRFVKM